MNMEQEEMTKQEEVKVKKMITRFGPFYFPGSGAPIAKE